MQRRTLLKRLGAGGTAAGIGAAAAAGPTLEDVVAGAYDDREWVVNLEGGTVPLAQFRAGFDDPAARLRQMGVTLQDSPDCCCEPCGGCLCCDC